MRLNSDLAHMWDLEPSEAIRLQERLREGLILEYEEGQIASVAGVDVHYGGHAAVAAIIVMAFPSLEPIEAVRGEAEMTFPYIPGLLSFREGPAVLEAWRQLRTDPDLLMFDAQGIAHPRRFGLAAHLGLLLDHPSIGVAKSRLYGLHETPGPNRGDRAALWDEECKDELIGTVLRTQDGVRPLYVSPGHRMDVAHAVEFVLPCCARYRLPEPTRWAHRVAGGAPFPRSA
jgi:deoxyribonuclease V